MNVDIESREDLNLLVRSFYDKLLEDEVVGYLFTEAIDLDLEAHFPRLVDFWEVQLLHSGRYEGNPMKVHLDLHQIEQLTKAHFDRWLELFNATVDAHFAGQKARLAKERALSIATVMQIKIAQL
jgi:hemoglobin